jgi:hypothetical protein
MPRIVSSARPLVADGIDVPKHAVDPRPHGRIVELFAGNVQCVLKPARERPFRIGDEPVEDDLMETMLRFWEIAQGSDLRRHGSTKRMRAQTGSLAETGSAAYEGQ